MKKIKIIEKCTKKFHNFEYSFSSKRKKEKETQTEKNHLSKVDCGI